MARRPLVAAVALVGAALLPACAGTCPCPRRTYYPPSSWSSSPPPATPAAAPTALPAPTPPVRSAMPAWDREAARRSVLAVVLADVATGHDAEAEGVVLVVDDTLQPTSVYGADHVPKPDRVGDVVPLPDGRKVYRPAIETLAAEAFDDWIAHTAPVPAPREITSPLPIEWFSEPPEAEAPARARLRTRKSAGFVRVSDVGFSASHRQALVQAMHGTDGCRVGAWLLLEREGARWKITARRRTFIACVCSLSPKITPTD